MAQSYPGSQTRNEDKAYARSGSGNDTAQMSGDKVREGVKSAEDTAQRMLEQGRQVGEGMSEVAGNLRGAVNQSLRDQPMATLAIAGIAGFVLGAIWKS
jgi:ElaB/YqjD/DUF883 family membrane-anchored ribosome-binding protein